MEWIIGIIAVLFVLVTVFGRLNEKPETPPSKKLKPRKATPKVSGVRAYHEYATIFEDHEHRPLTSDQVAEMFGGIRERLKEHRKAAKAMQKLADKFLETGKLDDVAYAALTDAESDVRHTIDAAEALNDKLFFNNSSASSRYYKFVDDLWEVESHIEFARRDIQDTRQAIEDGEFIPQKRVKSKAVKKSLLRDRSRTFECAIGA